MINFRSLASLFFPRGTGIFGKEFDVIDFKTTVFFFLFLIKQELTWRELLKGKYSFKM